MPITPAGSAASIEAAAETPIGEWAPRTNFPRDKLCATEEREGGTRAVGGRRAGIAREALSVFSREEGVTAKRATMFDVWVVAARRAVR